MPIRLRLLFVVCSCCAALSAAALDAVPARPVDLSGSWQLNTASSDDPEHMLEELQRLERERYMKWRREQERAYPPGAPPPIDVEGTATPRGPSPSRRASIKRHQENLHRMLAISDTLVIHQEGSTLDILVENGGRLNFGKDFIYDRKGIVGQIWLNGEPVANCLDLLGRSLIAQHKATPR